jgi:hypothetical protein
MHATRFCMVDLKPPELVYQHVCVFGMSPVLFLPPPPPPPGCFFAAVHTQQCHGKKPRRASSLSLYGAAPLLSLSLSLSAAALSLSLSLPACVHEMGPTLIAAAATADALNNKGTQSAERYANNAMVEGSIPYSMSIVDVCLFILFKILFY